jgi:hypothetical protein
VEDLFGCFFDYVFVVLGLWWGGVGFVVFVFFVIDFCLFFRVFVLKRFFGI